jgi:hypothetical protein
MPDVLTRTPELILNFSSPEHIVSQFKILESLEPDLRAKIFKTLVESNSTAVLFALKKLVEMELKQNNAVYLIRGPAGDIREALKDLIVAYIDKYDGLRFSSAYQENPHQLASYRCSHQFREFFLELMTLSVEKGTGIPESSFGIGEDFSEILKSLILKRGCSISPNQNFMHYWYAGTNNNLLYRILLEKGVDFKEAYQDLKNLDFSNAQYKPVLAAAKNQGLQEIKMLRSRVDDELLVFALESMTKLLKNELTLEQYQNRMNLVGKAPSKGLRVIHAVLSGLMNFCLIFMVAPLAMIVLPVVIPNLLYTILFSTLGYFLTMIPVSYLDKYTKVQDPYEPMMNMLTPKVIACLPTPSP